MVRAPIVPAFPASEATRGGLVLTQEYTFHWFWYRLWNSFAQPFYEAALKRRVPPSEFNTKLNEATRRIQKEIISESDSVLLEARRKLGPQIKGTLEAAFK